MVYSEINIWSFSFLLFFAFVLFSPCVVSAEEPKKTLQVSEVTGKCELFETITVKVENLPVLLAQAGNNLSKIILYLDGYPLSGIHPRRESTSGNELIFDLIMIEDSETAQTQNSWDSLLGRPNLFPPEPRKVNITVGIENQPPIDTVVRGSLMLFNRLPTISRPLADWWRTDCQPCRKQYMQEFLFIDGKGSFPWTKENARRCPPLHSTIFGISEKF